MLSPFDHLEIQPEQPPQPSQPLAPRLRSRPLQPLTWSRSRVATGQQLHVAQQRLTSHRLLQLQRRVGVMSSQSRSTTDLLQKVTVEGDEFLDALLPKMQAKVVVVASQHIVDSKRAVCRDVNYPAMSRDGGAIVTPNLELDVQLDSDLLGSELPTYLLVKLREVAASLVLLCRFVGSEPEEIQQRVLAVLGEPLQQLLLDHP